MVANRPPEVLFYRSMISILALDVLPNRSLWNAKHRHKFCSYDAGCNPTTREMPKIYNYLRKLAWSYPFRSRELPSHLVQHVPLTRPTCALHSVSDEISVVGCVDLVRTKLTYTHWGHRLRGLTRLSVLLVHRTPCVLFGIVYLRVSVLQTD